MSGADIPEFSHDNPADSSRPDVFMGLYDIDLTDKMQQLKEALANDRRADFASYRFGFYDQDVLAEVFLPPQIQSLVNRCGNLNSISVECTSPKDCDATSFEVCFDFKDEESEDGRITRLTVERPFDYQPDQDSFDVATVRFVDDDEEETSEKTDSPVAYITPMSRKDFNCLLASLVYRSDNISIDAFASLNWHTESFEKTIENFNSVAEYSICNEEYILHNSTDGIAGVLRINYYDETITDIQLDRIVTHDITMDEQGNMDFKKQLIEAWITPVGDHTVSFWSCDERNNDQPEWKELDANVADYDTTIEFVNKQLQRIRPTQFEVFDEDTTQPPED